MSDVVLTWLSPKSTDLYKAEKNECYSLVSTYADAIFSLLTSLWNSNLWVSCMVQATYLYKIYACVTLCIYYKAFSVSGLILNNGFKIVCNSKSCWLKITQIYQPRGYLLTGDSYSITKCTFPLKFFGSWMPLRKSSYLELTEKT